MKVTYKNCDCSCCKSKLICKFSEEVKNFKLKSTVEDASLPLEININCQHFGTEVNYR